VAETAAAAINERNMLFAISRLLGSVRASIRSGPLGEGVQVG
jgi:hypothetical protein